MPRLWRSAPGNLEAAAPTVCGKGVSPRKATRPSEATMALLEGGQSCACSPRIRAPKAVRAVLRPVVEA